MNKGVLLAFALPILLLSIMSVSATTTAPTTLCDPAFTTVGGTIYIDTLNNVVPNANVSVVCHDGSNGELTLNTLSDLKGHYKVVYNEGNSFCHYGSNVTVTADKAGMNGQNDGEISKTFTAGCITLNVGVVNVPLVPEFGLIAGLATIAGAAGLFFLVRRK